MCFSAAVPHIVLFNSTLLDACVLLVASALQIFNANNDDDD